MVEHVIIDIFMSIVLRAMQQTCKYLSNIKPIE